MKGDKKRFDNMKAQLVDNCGPKWGKQMIAAGKETECRRLLGVSTPTEVLSADGFKGKWNPSVQPQVDKIVKQMSASKLYGPTMKKVLQTVGGGKALDTTRTRAKKRKAVSFDDINSDDDDEDGNMLNMLRELVKGQRDMNSRVDQLEAGVTDLHKADEDEDDEDDSGDEDSDNDDEHRVTKTDKANKLENLLATWKGDQNGVPNKATRRAAEKNSEPARPKGAAEASGAFLRLMDEEAPTRAKKKAKTATDAKPSSKKKQILDLMDSMNARDFLSIAGADQFMRELEGDTDKSKGERRSTFIPSGESLAKPNFKWKPGICLFFSDFASKSGNDIKDMVASKLKREDKEDYELKLDGAQQFTVKSKIAQIDIKSMTERSICVQKFISFCLFSGQVKNMQSDLQRAQHRQYETRLLILSQKFKFEFILQYDVLFQSRLFDGPCVEDGLTSWIDRPQDLFNDVFMSQLYTRIGDNPTTSVRGAKPHKGEERQKIKPGKNKKDSRLKDVNAKGEQLCKNYNRGFCEDKTDRQGKECTREHQCQFCLKKHRTTECEDYAKALSTSG